jgi:hypothetical protein
VPVIDHDGFVAAESAAVLLYIGKSARPTSSILIRG